jgi:hypothetical protein
VADDLLQKKIDEFRSNADACEHWATTVKYPEIRQALLEVASQWRAMAERFERIQIEPPLDGRW